MRGRWFVLSLLSAVSASAASGGTKASALVASPGALALRREYNGVAATIDTLVRLYSADRLARLARARTPHFFEDPGACRRYAARAQAALAKKLAS